MKISNWHNRYRLQAFWTYNLRQFLIKKSGLQPGASVLDVGSGTGALFEDFQSKGFQVTGVDNDFERCLFSLQLNNDKNVLCADVCCLPFSEASFELSFCHYLLLWMRKPVKILQEMKRVTKPGGYVMAFAEPDYLSRIDYPAIFQKIGQYQNHSLEFQGVDLSMGRKLGNLFRGLGLTNVRIGLLAGEWKEPSEEVFLSEWDIIAYDLGGFVPVDDILSLKAQAEETWLSGSATVFIPTFYAYGQVDYESSVS